MTHSIDPADPSDALETARSELRESLENSREMVRQSHLLIELSEAEGAIAGGEAGPLAN